MFLDTLLTLNTLLIFKHKLTDFLWKRNYNLQERPKPINKRLPLILVSFICGIISALPTNGKEDKYIR